MTTQLIVALDFDNQDDAYHLVKSLNPKQCILKVGHEMFTAFGPGFVETLVHHDFRVFLDLKYYDIPNTVSKACKAAARLGVWMINVHASGGFEMMRAAKEALDAFSHRKTYLIAVTMLTSFNEEGISQIGINNTLDAQIKLLARLSLAAGLNGVVCSAWESEAIKASCGDDFITVTPGIRLDKSLSNDDQKRVVTPEDAARFKSDFIVVGRPITRAARPQEAVDSILKRLALDSTL